MGKGFKTIAVAIALFAAACTPPAPEVDVEKETFAVRTAVAKNPADQIAADTSRMRIIRNIELSPAGDTAHVEGEYVVASKSKTQELAAWDGKFAIEAKKTDGVWTIASDDLSPYATSAAPSAAPK